jgi:transposase InsO family protein
VGKRWPLDIRLAVARAVVEGQASGYEAARRFSVPYTTLSEWVRWYRAGGVEGLKPQPRPQRKRDARREASVTVKREQPQAGGRRIRDVMKRFFGIGTSETTVRRVLQAEGITQKREPPKAKPKPKPVRFERAEPNQLWQSDLFTFLLRKHQRVYVAAFLDDHSRYLVSLAMAHHQKSSLVMEALARGIADYGTPREILTDQGRQYTTWRGSTDFEEELRRHGIRHVKSRPHHPQTCGKIERFWKTMWEEFLSRTVFADFEDCQRRIALFIQHYNFQRPHQTLDGLTPADRFFRSAAQVRAVVEANVAANALRLAREQPARKPFYLVGRLGDRDLTISTSGSNLRVRVGDEETVISLAKEIEHEDQATSTTRWDYGRKIAEAPAPGSAAMAGQVAGPGRDCAQPVSAGAVGAFGREGGDRGDRRGQDLAAGVLRAGDPGAAGDADGAQPAGRGEGRRDGGPGGGELPDPGAGAQGDQARAGQAPGGAPAADDAQEPAPWADAQAAALDPDTATALAALEDEGGEQRHLDPDAGWRGRILSWDRKLSGERAGAAREEGAHGQEEELHAGAGGAIGGGRAPGGGDGGGGGDQDHVGGRQGAAPVAQSLPDAGAPRGRGHDRGDQSEAGGKAGEATEAGGAGGASGEAAARERAAAQQGGIDRPLAGSSQRPAARPDPGAAPSVEGDAGESQ